ncbi:hypothetical protein HDU76_003551 [Blyttiomyces sp. JEL0837]|nr:hypothetical protein HDU76_003551 [Blyttiomyces sp. JEL0837]
MGFVGLCTIAFIVIWLRLKKFEKIEAKGKIWTDGPRAGYRSGGKVEPEWSKKMRKTVFERSRKAQGRGRDQVTNEEDSDITIASTTTPSNDLEKNSEPGTPPVSIALPIWKRGGGKRSGGDKNGGEGLHQRRESGTTALMEIERDSESGHSTLAENNSHHHLFHSSNGSNGDNIPPVPSLPNADSISRKPLPMVYDSEEEEELLPTNRIRIKILPTPDRRAGGSSSWAPPHPLNQRHKVVVGHLPRESDEIALTRGEIVIVEKYFEDGWALVRREGVDRNVLIAAEREKEREREREAKKVAASAAKEAKKAGIVNVKAAEEADAVSTGLTAGTGAATGATTATSLFKGKKKVNKDDDGPMGGETGRGMVPYNCLYVLKNEVILVFPEVKNVVKNGEAGTGAGRI